MTPPKTDIVTQRYGALIANTGTPASPMPDDIRSYLRQMLMDPRLVNYPHPMWRLILERCILPHRPDKTAPRYRSIWTPEGSPFMLDSLAQRGLLQEELISRGLDIPVELGMRYGTPSFDQAIKRLMSRGCNAILLLPLFPQRAKVTTCSCLDEFARVTSLLGLTKTKAVEQYCERDSYPKALAASIRETGTLNRETKLLFTFHSTLVKDIKAGDPYYDQCWDTARRTAAELALSDTDWTCSFHSRFDSRKWVGPETNTVLTKWARMGVSDVAVISPSFASDCLETLVDISIEQKELFLSKRAAIFPNETPGSFAYIPCLGCRADHISLLADVVQDALTTTVDASHTS